jgi:serine/threonine-protein kinase
MGSYLCLIRHPGRIDVRYPISIGRQEHWHGVPPGGKNPHPISLPPVGLLAPEDCYVPAGWFDCGGDPVIDNSLPGRRVWVAARVFRRFPVTNQQYLMYLNALIASGKMEEAMRTAPRERESTVKK